METLCIESESAPARVWNKPGYSEELWAEKAQDYICGRKRMSEIRVELGCDWSTITRRCRIGKWKERRAEFLAAKENKPLNDLAPSPINTQFPELQRELIRASVQKLTEAQVKHYDHLDIVQRQIRDIDQELSECKDGGEKATLRKSLDMMLERQRIMLRIPGPPSSKMSEAPTMKTVPDSDNVEVAMLPGAPE